MTDETTNFDDDDLPMESELDALKARADLMNIKYHPSIGVDKLKEKIAEAMGEADESPEVEADEAPAEPVGETPNQRKIRLKKEANQLIRCRVTCMNPNKSEWEGEILTVANAAVGTIKKYVPFNTEWHVPRFILNVLKARECQVFYTYVDKRTGNKTRKGKLVKEFAIEELPPLTKEELRDLAQRQAMANGTAAA